MNRKERKPRGEEKAYVVDGLPEKLQLGAGHGANLQHQIKIINSETIPLTNHTTQILDTQAEQTARS